MTTISQLARFLVKHESDMRITSVHSIEQIENKIKFLRETSPSQEAIGETMSVVVEVLNV